MICPIICNRRNTVTGYTIIRRKINGLYIEMHIILPAPTPCRRQCVNGESQHTSLKICLAPRQRIQQHKHRQRQPKQIPRRCAVRINQHGLAEGIIVLPRQQQFREKVVIGGGHRGGLYGEGQGAQAGLAGGHSQLSSSCGFLRKALPCSSITACHSCAVCRLMSAGSGMHSARRAV